MATSEFLMNQPEEIKIFSTPSYRHYMSGIELIRRFARGHRHLVLNHGAEFDPTGKEKEAKELFDKDRQYFLKDHEIHIVE